MPWVPEPPGEGTDVQAHAFGFHLFWMAEGVEGRAMEEGGPENDGGVPQADPSGQKRESHKIDW